MVLHAGAPVILGLAVVLAAGCNVLFGIDDLETQEEATTTTGSAAAGGGMGAGAHGGGEISRGCADELENGAETDVDCGGGICPDCDNGKTCKTDDDCKSNLCDTTGGGVGGTMMDPAEGVCAACKLDHDCRRTEFCDATLAGGTCLDKKSQGAQCLDGTECTSGFCTDGVCCESACSEKCRACSQQKTGKPDGTCDNVSAMSDPDLECPGSYCNGSGACACVAEASLGFGHTCARKGNGTLSCWGQNTFGQLGDGTTANKASAVPVTKLGATVVEVTLGAAHTCARKEDGTLFCWGRNAYGQLGDGTTVNKASPVPVTVLGATVVEVALGSGHTCARKGDGTLFCWGDNYYGQLGDGTTVDKSSPAPTKLGVNVAEVALGYRHSCARKQDGTLFCWGDNTFGRLGDGTIFNKSSPVAVAALGATVVAVALGDSHTCARKQDGTLFCWGSNEFGQLGDGTTVNKSSPVAVTALGATVAEVALGFGHTCARKQNGTLFCWGLNASGQLGDGTTVTKSSPVPVTALGATVVAVALGGHHSCARKEDGTLSCWGDNYYGQLGDGTSADKSSPVGVPLCP
jgi:alpha-tubulin suppressor-like RCC1 family protein